jgi:hypothetical protein
MRLPLLHLKIVRGSSWARQTCRACRWYFLHPDKPIPKRMLQEQRDPVQDFDPAELLFLRCKNEWLDANGGFRPQFVAFPDQSTNRSRFSSPYDVLLSSDDPKSKDFWCWGVVQFRVNQLPPADKTTSGAGKKLKETGYTFTVEHDPDPRNYGHCELRVYKDGIRTSSVSSKELKKRYRLKLARALLLRAAPMDDSEPNADDDF